MPVPILTEVELEMKMEIIVLQTQMKEAKESLTAFVNQINDMNVKFVELSASVKPMMGYATGTLLEPGEMVSLTGQEGAFQILNGDGQVPVFTMGQQPYTPGDLILDLGNGIKGKLTNFDPETGVGTITIAYEDAESVVSVSFGLNEAESGDAAVIDEILSQPDGLMARDF